jgi:hypothetical protein
MLIDVGRLCHDSAVVQVTGNPLVSDLCRFSPFSTVICLYKAALLSNATVEPDGSSLENVSGPHHAGDDGDGADGDDDWTCPCWIPVYEMISHG